MAKRPSRKGLLGNIRAARTIVRETIKSNKLKRKVRQAKAANKVLNKGGRANSITGRAAAQGAARALRGRKK